jgi:hypothetical protein
MFSIFIYKSLISTISMTIIQCHLINIIDTHIVMYKVLIHQYTRLCLVVMTLLKSI